MAELPNKKKTLGTSISPPNLDFGSAGVGSSSGPRTVTFMNNSGVVLQVAQVMIGGNARGDFSESHSGSQVANGSDFLIQVTFSPVARGLRLADLALRFSDGTMAGPVQLTGTGS